MPESTARSCIPVYIIIGTRGQFTKTAPVIRELDKKGIPYALINTGQHTIASREIARNFGIKAGDRYLTQRAGDIEKPAEATRWFVEALCALVINRKQIFTQGPGLVIIHGDTLSTLAALIGSRLCGMKVAHIESGLRSHSYLHPFPEEIIRILACRFSHVLFAPSQEAYQNLAGYSAQSFNSCGNTVFDAVQYVAALSSAPPPMGPYCVATIHRSELIFRNDLLRIALDAIYQAAAKLKVIFVVHKATLARLRATGEIDTIQNNPNIMIKDYYSYPAFMALVKSAEFVMTDGGGLQEETCFLNVPCLLLRKRTERKDGLGTTALLSELNPEKITYFLENHKQFRQSTIDNPYPSRFIAEKVAELVCVKPGS